MVFTAGQTTAFFEGVDQMGIPNATVVQLQEEGISTVSDLEDFDKDTIEQVAVNLRRPAGRVPDPAPNAAAGATIPTPPFVFGAKSQKRLIVATDLVKYYTTIGRPITAANMAWNTVMKNFEIQWKALIDKSKVDTPEVPKITKTLPIIRWTEAFTDHLHRVIGIRKIPLAYVIRADEAVEDIGNCPLAQGAPHSAKHGSIEDELIDRGSHTHALFREDNQAVYYQLEEATRSTPYAASIKPFQRPKNGRAAWLALSSQYAGNDKWEAEIKRHEQFLHTRQWKGQTNFSLERFIAQHRNAFVAMQAASEHVTYQLPNEHSRVGYVLDNIQCNDAGLQAAMASVKTDTTAGGLRNNFEAMATHLLPYDPVQKKRAAAGDKRPSAEISDMTGEEATISSFGTKKGIGKTGVHLRYHSPEEYKALTRAQSNELRDWRKSSEGIKDKKKARTNPKWQRGSKAENDKAIASAVERKVALKMKALEDEKTQAAEAEALIMAIISKHAGASTNGGTVSGVQTTQTTTTTLKTILGRARNGSQKVDFAA
jgi:hypothetical protein